MVSSIFLEAADHAIDDNDYVLKRNGGFDEVSFLAGYALGFARSKGHQEGTIEDFKDAVRIALRKRGSAPV